jgi:hypothetical protein
MPESTTRLTEVTRAMERTEVISATVEIPVESLMDKLKQLAYRAFQEQEGSAVQVDMEDVHWKGIGEDSLNFVVLGRRRLKPQSMEPPEAEKEARVPHESEGTAKPFRISPLPLPTVEVRRGVFTEPCVILNKEQFDQTFDLFRGWLNNYARVLWQQNYPPRLAPGREPRDLPVALEDLIRLFVKQGQLRSIPGRRWTFAHGQDIVEYSFRAHLDIDESVVPPRLNIRMPFSSSTDEEAFNRLFVEGIRDEEDNDTIRLVFRKLVFAALTTGVLIYDPEAEVFYCFPPEREGDKYEEGIPDDDTPRKAAPPSAVDRTVVPVKPTVRSVVFNPHTKQPESFNLHIPPPLQNLDGFQDQYLSSPIYGEMRRMWRSESQEMIERDPKARSAWYVEHLQKLCDAIVAKAMKIDSEKVNGVVATDKGPEVQREDPPSKMEVPRPETAIPRSKARIEKLLNLHRKGLGG